MHPLARFALVTCCSGLISGAMAEEPKPDHIPVNHFIATNDLEVTLWAKSPLLNNPTNMDWDAQGRAWITQSTNYRNRKDPRADSVVVISDTDGDGTADDSHVFVTDKDLVSPLGIAVLGNVILVSCSPNLIKYTDVNRNAVFDPDVDLKEKILTDHGRRDHDHSLHAVVVGPDGRWYYNMGNAGPVVWTSTDGFTLKLTSRYLHLNKFGPIGQPSSDGRVYIGGALMSLQPDGTQLEIHAHNFRNAYEHTVDSFGDLWQNDNDDPPASRTTWLMDGANMGFASRDGSRSWQQDQRPWQTTPIAHWRQHDPGTHPPGHVYGRGAPTGIVMYENGSLGDQHIGTLLSAEAVWSEIFGYQPQQQGAGFALEKFPFMNSYLIDGDTKGVSYKWFRPSDVSVGPDGFVYVADWFDPGVGGHRTGDKGKTGAIYRVAPANAKPTIPPHSLETVNAAVQVLLNPSINVRAIGANALVDFGETAIPAVKALLDHDNHFIRARAIWVLARIGGKATALVEQQLSNEHPRLRLAAYRALHRHHGGDADLSLARRFASDADAGIRRDVAIDMRGRPLADTKNIISTIAKAYDGVDRWYLEALGTACEGHESEAYDLLAAELAGSDPLAWDARFAGIAWRLHPPQALDAMLQRAMSSTLDLAQRHQAIVAIGFIHSQAAADAMRTIATSVDDLSLSEQARWWLHNGSKALWSEYTIDLTGIPDTKVKPPKIPGVKPNQKGPKGEGLSRRIFAIKDLKGDATRGRELFHGRGTCMACHSAGGVGGQLGPELTGIADAFGYEAFYEALLVPSAGIALGFEYHSVNATVDGEEVTIVGKLQQDGDSISVVDISGKTHEFTRSQVSGSSLLQYSIMPPSDSLGLKNQDLADLFEFLRSQD